MIIQKGDIILYHGKTWFEKLIRWFTDSAYSHVGIAYDISEDKIEVAQALYQGFVKTEESVINLLDCKNITIMRVSKHYPLKDI